MDYNFHYKYFGLFVVKEIAVRDVLGVPLPKTDGRFLDTKVMMHSSGFKFGMIPKYAVGVPVNYIVLGSVPHRRLSDPQWM